VKPTKNKSIVLFDGVCNLCNASVQFILKHDKKQHFIFAALQSDVAKELLLHYPDYIIKKDSILLIQNDCIYSESSAILHIIGQFSGGWKALMLFWIVPKFIRDAIYRFIAKNRYQWFGKRKTCLLPFPEYEKRFL